MRERTNLLLQSLLLQSLLLQSLLLQRMLRVLKVARYYLANCQLPTANCQLPTANCQLPTANCQLPGYLMPSIDSVISQNPPVVSPQNSVARCSNCVQSSMH
jgi:hypothetical protein